MIFSLNFLKKFYCIENKNLSIPFYCSSHNKKLASEYRKNVIYNNNYDPYNVSCDCFSSRNLHRNNKIRKFSHSSLSNDNENNISETTNSSNSNHYESVSYNNFNSYDNDNDSLDNFEYNKILDLNFNELLIGDLENEKEENIINFDNVSPKDKIPISLYYDNEGILD